MRPIFGNMVVDRENWPAREEGRQQDPIQKRDMVGNDDRACACLAIIV